MLEDFIIGRIRGELAFEPNEEKEGLFKALGAFLVSRAPRKAFILRGYAGTGKTSVTSALVRAMSGLKQPCVLLAPTGRAAKVLSRYSGFPAYTIHKQIYRQTSAVSRSYLFSDGAGSFTLSENRHRNTLFIVDEASMLSGQRELIGRSGSPLFGSATFGSGCLLDDLVQYVYSGQGCSLLLLGDDAQLPPVGSGESPALEEEYMRGYGLDVTGYRLREVARQALDSGILSEATRLREEIGKAGQAGTTGAGKSAGLTEGIKIKANGKDIIQVPGDEVIERIEDSRREVGAEESLIITRSNKMTNLYNGGVRAHVLWKEEDISNGDRIMVTKNNYFWAEEYKDLEFIANGDMFEVERLYNRHKMYGFEFARASLRSIDYDWEIEALLWLDTLKTDSPDMNYGIQKELFSRIAEDYPEIRSKKELVKKIYESPYFNALQVRFAYCVTCHKAQGGQWKHVYIDTGLSDESLSELGVQEKHEYLRWLYTAATRATEKIYLLR